MTTWLTTSEVATLSDVSERTIRLRVENGGYPEWRYEKRGKSARSIVIALTSLSQSERARFYELHPQLTTKPRSVAASELPPPIFSFDNATPAQKLRAKAREAAVHAFERFLIEWGGQSGLTAAKERWVEHYRLTHAGFRISVDSVERWLSAYRAYDLDGLVDGNDGSSRRGKTKLPSELRQFFEDVYVDPVDQSAPSVAQAIFDTKLYAECVLKSDAAERVSAATFYRLKDRISKTRRVANREGQDDEELVIFTGRRDHRSIKAMQLVVADHHLTDRWVHCGDGYYVLDQDRLVASSPMPRVCSGDRCVAGHRVWITAFMDVASRRVVSWIASLDYPRTETIRQAFKQLVDDYGLPEAVYVDNGKDFKSAFGKAVRRHEALPVDEHLLNNLLASLRVRVVFARPYKARSKSIERLFGTLVRQLWRGHPAYTGSLGKRTERAESLRKQPHLLISLEEFRGELATYLDLYHCRTHRGQGMDGRSPEEVFRTHRIAERRPEKEGFAIAFWQWFGRQVHAGGTVVVGEDRYVLDPIVGPKVLGSKVQVLVDPQDVNRALILSGCEHTDSKHSRTKSLACSCRGKSEVLCWATRAGLGSYVASDITAAHLAEQKRINREVRREARGGNLQARRALQLFKANREQFLGVIRDKERTRVAARIAANGSAPAEPITVITAHSKIGRRAADYHARLSAPAFSAEERELARTVELPSIEELRAMQPDEDRFVLLPVDEDGDMDVRGQLDEIAIERALQERAEAGYCTATPTCDYAHEAGHPFCRQHRQELLGE